MAVKLQTFKDIRNYLTSELANLYTEREIRSLINLLVSSIFGNDTMFYLTKENEIMADAKKTDKLIKYCNDLKSGMPVQYVTGETIFYNCKIKVSQEVFIPRPETEELVDLIIMENRGFSGNIIDIATGSGAIAVALAANIPSAQIKGIDISAAAINIAKKNAELNKVKIMFSKSDIFKIQPSSFRNTDMIICNPPYVRNSEKKYMKKNVLEFEPHGALFVSDEDPLIYYRTILSLARETVNHGGKVYFEINEAMGNQMHELMEAFNFTKIEIIKDLNGKDRIAKGEK